MGIKKENVTDNRVLVAYAFDFLSSGVEAFGSTIDTVGFENGLFFNLLCFSASDAVLSYRILHSDSASSGFGDVEPENLVYGRKDGRLPIIDLNTPLVQGSFVSREGVVGTKRYVKVAVKNSGPSTAFFPHVLATQTSDNLFTGSDAVYS